MLPDFLSKKKFAVARSQMESSQVSPLGGHLDFWSTKAVDFAFLRTHKGYVLKELLILDFCAQP